MKRIAVRVLTHLLALVAGISAGVYALPIMTEPEAPGASDLAAIAVRAEFTVRIEPQLAGHDFIHWGEGTVFVARDAVALDGRIGPGPDYKLYLTPAMVESEAEFWKIKDASLRVGNVETFHDFIVRVPEGTDLSRYKAIVVWCETFSRFITAAQYR